MAITPCVRDEIEDDIHLSVFLKLELIIIGKHDVNSILDTATSFFNRLTDKINIVDSWNKPFEKDILINEVEVGSCGIGYMQDGTPYTYGTGIAEPRLSFALLKSNI